MKQRKAIMFHPHLQRIIVLAAGLVFLAYAISTDEEPARDRDIDDEDKKDQTEAPSTNLVDTAAAAGRFGTWSLGVKQSGLAEKLEGEGPFTIFAPTDDAFGKIGPALDELLADKSALRQTLEAHIVDGNLKSTDLAAGATLTTLAGTNLTVTATDGIAIGESKVMDADLTASNGVIHGIDTVLPTDAKPE